MEIEFTIKAKEHLAEWKKTGDKSAMNKIEKLLESIQKDPFNGYGKPELLKYNWAGFWSRRITKEHRLIYNVQNNVIIIYALRGHYQK